jgi:uncharacterized membrane protein YkoI
MDDMNNKSKLMKSLPKITLISASIIVCLITASSIGALSGTNLTPKLPDKDTTSVPTMTTPAVYIGEAAAKDIVLAKAPGVTINEFHFEFDDGVAEYDGEAYLDTTKYDFEINAVTGVITEWKTEVKPVAPTPDTTQVYIGIEAAKAVVLKKVPGVTFKEIEFEKDDGVGKYEGEAYLDTTKYEFKINAVTGVIMEWKSEVKPVAATPTTVYIGVEAAKAIALTKAPGATFKEIYLENCDGKVEYDGEMFLDNTKYEFSIDAVTGAITDWEVEVKDSKVAQNNSNKENANKGNEDSNEKD